MATNVQHRHAQSQVKSYLFFRENNKELKITYLAF
jgi:hypothetical protein